ncbi:MAG: type II CAAX endopeptidase family protein [Chloroflexota bacterium]
MSILVLISGAAAGAIGLMATMLFAQASVILPALLWIAIRRWPVRTTLRLHPIDWRTAMWSVLIGLACWPVVAGMSALIEQGLSLIGPGPQIPYPTGLVESVIYAVVLIILAPLTEEPVFRGFVLGAWLRCGTVMGLALSGFLFASFHFQLAALIPLTFLGVALGLLVHRSNSLYSSMIAHAAYNTAGTLFIFTPSLREAPERLLMIAGVIALPIAVLLLWAFTRRFPPSAEDSLARESSPWAWTVLSLLAVLGISGLIALGELYLRLSPNLVVP